MVLFIYFLVLCRATKLFKHLRELEEADSYMQQAGISSSQALETFLRSQGLLGKKSRLLKVAKPSKSRAVCPEQVLAFVRSQLAYYNQGIR